MDLPRRLLYATDASIYEQVPLAVFLPREAGGIQAAVSLCQELGVPLTARGAGTSLAGQAIGPGLVVDTSRYMDGILELDEAACTVRIQPGVVLDHLNRYLMPSGLQVGPDPASGNRATIGGMVATNATGARSIAYGMMVDHVRALRVILSDGSEATFSACSPEEWQQKARHSDTEGRLYREVGALLEHYEQTIRTDTPPWWRRAGGYRLERLLDTERPNMASLFCGSEGTLGIITEITLGLVRRPRHRVLGVAHFRSRREAIASVEAILETGPTAVELFDEVGLRRCREVPEYARMLFFVEGTPGALLIVEYAGEALPELEARLDDLQRVVVGEGRGTAVVRVITPEKMQQVWQVRRVALGLIMGVKGDRKPIAVIEDAAVPVRHLNAYIEDLESRIREAGTEAVIYAHASAGCLHVRPFLSTKDPEDLRRMVHLARYSMEQVKRYGGVISSEHGDGYVRTWLNPEFYGSSLYEAYVQTKHIFDPEGILNPGKVVEGPSVTDNLRMGPDYKVIPLQTHLDFSDEGGFAQAVERCNGVGVCRKMQPGVMCPSFRATRDEMHATRGRANLLREALAGKLLGGMHDPALKEALSLCLSCKACKAECPSSVDMARLKMEWQAHAYKAHPPDLRERLFAYYPTFIARMPAFLRSFSRLLHTKPVRFFLQRWMGIHTARRLPLPAKKDFRTWYTRQERGEGDPTVVLLPDTFNTYHEPEVLQAAYHLFRRLGYRVIVPREWFCCGRTWMSKGFVEEARRQARRTVDVLYPYVAEGVPVVGLEPSCLLSLRDEYHYLLPGDARVEVLSRQAHLFEEYMADVLEASGAPEERAVYYHAHCHQRALSGTEAPERLLRPFAGRLQVLDTGCCGMAGAFGYEHYALSMKIGNLALFPALRQADAADVVLATGFSCRHQIADGTGKRALHPAQFLWQQFQHAHQLATTSPPST